MYTAIKCLFGVVLLIMCLQNVCVYAQHSVDNECYITQYPGSQSTTNTCAVESPGCTGHCTKTLYTIPIGTVCETCVSSGIMITDVCYTLSPGSVSATDFTAGCLLGLWSCYCDTYSSTPAGPPYNASCGQVDHGSNPPSTECIFN